MKPLTSCVVLCGCLLGVAPLAGCTFEAGVATSPPPVETTGSVTLRWSIAATTAPVQCAEHDADTLELTLYDETHEPILVTNAPCEAFNVTVDLAPGLYDGAARLVDVNGRPRTLTLPIHDLRVTRGTELVVDIEFPWRSLL